MGKPEAANKHYKTSIAVAVTAALMAAILAIRSTRNTLAVPYVVVVDSSHEAFNFVTRFKKVSLS